MVFRTAKSRNLLASAAWMRRKGFKGKFQFKKPASKSYVRKAIKRYEKANVEKKWMHVPFNYGVSTAGNTLQITSIPQGDTENTRDGRQINLVGLHLRFSIDFSTTPHNVVRFIVFQWYGYPVGGSQPLLSDILESADVQAHYAHKSSGSYRILYDRVFTVTTYRPHVEKIVHLNLTRLGRHRKVEFDQNPASFTRHDNGLQLLLISDDGAIPYPVVKGIAHVTFTDA